MNAGVVLVDFDVAAAAGAGEVVRVATVETADVVDALLRQLGPSPSSVTARPEPIAAA